jgi:integrase
MADRDDTGRYADFHSLRHSFISNLARSGVHPKVARALARHSTITLTMDRYSYTLIEEQAEALSALPDFDAEEPAEHQKANNKPAQ